MSKPEKEKRIVNFENAPILADLEFPELVKEFHKFNSSEKEATAEAEKWKKKKQIIGVDIQTAIETAEADTVVYETSKRVYRATLIKGEPGSKTDEDKLKLNLMKIGKLDAGIIAKIFAASQVPTEAKKSYILLTVTE